MVNSDTLFKWFSRKRTIDSFYWDPMLHMLSPTRISRQLLSCNTRCYSTKVPKALDEASLRLISDRLRDVPKLKFQFNDSPKDAAVLMPLCSTMDGKPSVLFTIRAAHMRAHKGEIRLVLYILLSPWSQNLIKFYNLTASLVVSKVDNSRQ
jgi:hypothetical protein